MEQKSLLDKVQVVFTILTSLILGIGGFVINSNQQEISNGISRLEQTVSTVEAMGPYFEMLAGSDPAKAKMAAYALYMLNERDPQMTVSLVLAANREELDNVLKDIGNRDPKILNILAAKITSKEGETKESAPQSELEASAKNIIQSISTESSGWSYLGTYSDNKWSASTIKIGNELPEAGAVYEIIDDVYLRDNKPTFKLFKYKLGNVSGVIKKGQEIRIDKLDTDVGLNRVWAEVTVISR